MNRNLNKTKSDKKLIKSFAVMFAAAILLFALCSCMQAHKQEGYANYDVNDMPGFSDSLANEYEKPQEGSSNSKVNEKLIEQVDIAAETLKFDEAKNDILELVSRTGGYISNSKVTGGERYEYGRMSSRSAEYEIRIPQENLDAFLKEVGGRINIYASQEKVTDATETYYDIQARLETLNSKREALNEMLAKAETTSQLLDIQEKLYQTIGEIESYKARLLVIDSQVAYSTVYLKLYEVEVYTQVEEEPFGKQISESFKEGWAAFVEGWKNFAIWFVGALPGLIVFAVFVVATVFIIRGIVKKSRKKAAKRAEEARQVRELMNQQISQNQQQQQPR